MDEPLAFVVGADYPRIELMVARILELLNLYREAKSDTGKLPAFYEQLDRYPDLGESAMSGDRKIDLVVAAAWCEVAVREERAKHERAVEVFRRFERVYRERDLNEAGEAMAKSLQCSPFPAGATLLLSAIPTYYRRNIGRGDPRPSKRWIQDQAKTNPAFPLPVESRPRNRRYDAAQVDRFMRQMGFEYRPKGAVSAD